MFSFAKELEALGINRQVLSTVASNLKYSTTDVDHIEADLINEAFIWSLKANLEPSILAGFLGTTSERCDYTTTSDKISWCIDRFYDIAGDEVRCNDLKGTMAYCIVQRLLEARQIRYMVSTCGLDIADAILSIDNNVTKYQGTGQRFEYYTTVSGYNVRFEFLPVDWKIIAHIIVETGDIVTVSTGFDMSLIDSSTSYKALCDLLVESVLDGCYIDSGVLLEGFEPRIGVDGYVETD